MAGLREKQKQQRRNLIEVAAGELFVEKGFNDTTIEHIAERALVSPATVYNYYGTKGELLLALVARGEVGMKERMPAFLKRAESESPIDLLTDVMMASADDALAALGRELWGHVVAFIATTTDPEIAPRYIGTISSTQAGAEAEVIQKYIDLGTLPKSVSPEKLGQMLTRIERVHFLNFVYLKAQTREDLKKAIHLDVQQIFEVHS